MNKLKKQNLLKILILVISVFFNTQQAFSQASAVQTFSTSVPPAVAINKTSSSNSGSINPVSGEIVGSLTSSFYLEVNDGKNYDFIVYSTMLTADGTVSAFDKNGNLIFGNTTILPLSSSVENAKQNIAGNANVIVYPFELTIDPDMAQVFVSDATYEKCYKVNFLNDVAEGNLVQSIDNTPITNTYSLGEDVSGTYSTTVYITVVSK